MKEAKKDKYLNQFKRKRNLRVRLETTGKKNRRKKTIYNFFYLLSAHLMSIFSVVISYVH